MKCCVLLALLLGCSLSWAFDSCPSHSCEDSCKNRCGTKLDKAFSCQCNDPCERFGDCCADYHMCLYIDPSSGSSHEPPAKPATPAETDACQGRCGARYNKNDPCHCNKKCGKHKNCCEDYNSMCGGAETGAETTSASSQEPDETSCQGRCWARYNKEDPCHCNKKCGKHKNCCKDYNSACGGGGVETNSASNQDSAPADYSAGDGISQKEIEAVSESLYEADENRAKEGHITLNKQQMASKSGGKQDQSAEPFYSQVSEELLAKPTYSAFICLLNNYDRKTGTSEDVTDTEVKEQDNFLKEIMKTDVMRKLYTFFNKKKFYTSEEEFVTDLRNMWFGLYSRGKGDEQDSSGFEHVFVGEVKKGKVSGFHSWIRFYMLEKEGLVDYYSHNYDGPWTNFPDVIGKQFEWDGFVKEVGSAFIGSSPEFEFAIYSLCFIARPGKACTVSLGGHPLKIQTYTWTKSSYGNGKQYIATAYPVT